MCLCIAWNELIRGSASVEYTLSSFRPHTRTHAHTHTVTHTFPCIWCYILVCVCECECECVCLCVCVCTHVRVYVFACMHACVCMCVPELNKLCNLQGRQVEYVRQDDSNRRWFNEFRSKSTSTPIGLETVDGWYHIHWLCCVNCASGVGLSLIHI